MFGEEAVVAAAAIAAEIGDTAAAATTVDVGVIVADDVAAATAAANDVNAADISNVGASITDFDEVEDSASVSLESLSYKLYDRVARYRMAPYFAVSINQRLADAHREADYQQRLNVERLLVAQAAARFEYRLRAADRIDI